MITSLASVVLCIGLALLGLYLVRRFSTHEVRMVNNEVAGFFLAVLGVVYAVLLAFLVVIVWEDYTDARASSEKEANAMTGVYRLAAGLPEDVEARVQALAKAYLASVVNVEWPAMRAGLPYDGSEQHIAAIYPLVTSIPGADSQVEVSQAVILDHLTAAEDARHERWIAANEGLPPVMWGLLIGGGIVTVVFTYFLGTPNPKAHYAMTAVFTMSIAFVIVLIGLIVFPFRGEVSIPPNAFVQALQEMGVP